MKAANDSTVVAVQLPDTPLVERSIVTAGLPYAEYRQELRRDFFYSCGYCSLSEYEAQGLSFHIDHYNPQVSQPELRDEYGNLMYACGECNSLKSDFAPPAEAQAAGYRFYKPDNDVWKVHFVASGIRLNSLSNVGEFTIEALDLNRQSLRRLREIRHRLVESSEHIAVGVLGLRRFRIDQLPQAIKGRAVSAIAQVIAGADSMADHVDSVLKAAAQSPLLEPDAEKAGRREAWKMELTAIKGIYPGAWRGRDVRKNDAA